MCILIYSRMSGKAQRLDRHLATQFLPLIKDVTTREICAQRSAGCFSEIVLVLIQCVGLSPGYQFDVCSLWSEDYCASLFQECMDRQK